METPTPFDSQATRPEPLSICTQMGDVSAWIKDEYICNKHFRRFLINLLAFTYKVNLQRLSAALSTTSLAVTSETKSRPSLLTAQEQSRLRILSSVIDAAHRHIIDNKPYLIPTNDQQMIRHAVIRPADSLHVSAPFVLDHLCRYHSHQCRPWKRRKTMVYAGYLPFLDWRLDCAERLARQLVSDDILIWRIAPSESVGAILSAGVAKMRERHCRTSLGFERRFWIKGTFLDLADICRSELRSRASLRSTIHQSFSYHIEHSPNKEFTSATRQELKTPR